MIEKDIKLLKSRIDGEPVILHFTDGEIVAAKILSVSDSEKDIIFRTISTNRGTATHKVLRSTFDEVNFVT